MRRVFISHRNGEANVLSLINGISTHLAANGFDVLVDFDRLNPGASWRDDIYTWLGVCHAAVVVISKDVLAGDSVWVPRECSILSWRKTLDPAFTLIPVLLPGVTTDDLRTHLQFRDLGLHDLQIIDHIDNYQTCTAILKGLEHLTAIPRSPLEELAEQIEAQLGSIRTDFVDEAIVLTGADINKLPQLGETTRKLALSLLQVPLANALTALEYLAPRMSSTVSVDRILDIIAPGWVDLSAARWIAFCAASEPKPAAVVNASSRFAAEMYVRRASCKPPKTMWRVVSVTGVHGELVFEDLATEIVEALLTEFSTSLLTDPFDNAPESQLSGILHELNRRGRPVVVILRMLVGAVDLMPQLQDRFPYLTFLFLSGEILPDEDSCPETLIRRVEPALLPGQETSARTDYQTARSILRPGV